VLEIFRRDIDRVLALGGWVGISQVVRSILAPASAALMAGAHVEHARETGARPSLGVVATS
jgi:uncharacterized protein (UPF0261 family)